MSEALKVKKSLAIALIVVLVGFVVYSFLPYLGGLFGALILYTIFSPLYDWFVKKRVPKGLSAILIILLSIVIVMIPAVYLTSTLIQEIGEVALQATKFTEGLDALDQIIPHMDFQETINSQLRTFASKAQDILLSAVNSIANIVITLVIMFFMLFYMLTNSTKLQEIGHTFIPFNKKNSRKLINEFRTVTNSTIITTGLIAVLQGTALAIGLLIFGIEGAFLWGVIGTILSFLPVIGIPIIWFPAGIIEIAKGNMVAGVGILIWGLIISNADNFLRPYLQRKIGEMHPLITLIGVFIGIPIFGIIGLIMGPLMLSYMFLTMKMFREEYIENK